MGGGAASASGSQPFAPPGPPEGSSTPVPPEAFTPTDASTAPPEPHYVSACGIIFGFSLEHSADGILLLRYSSNSNCPAMAISETREPCDDCALTTCLRGVAEELLGHSEGSSAALSTALHFHSSLSSSGYRAIHLGSPDSLHRSFALHADVLFDGGIDSAYRSFLPNTEAAEVIFVPLGPLASEHGELGPLTGDPGETEVTDIHGRQFRLRGHHHLGSRRIAWIRDYLEAHAADTISALPDLSSLPSTSSAGRMMTDGTPPAISPSGDERASNTSEADSSLARPRRTAARTARAAISSDSSTLLAGERQDEELSESAPRLTRRRLTSPPPSPPPPAPLRSPFLPTAVVSLRPLYPWMDKENSQDNSNIEQVEIEIEIEVEVESADTSSDVDDADLAPPPSPSSPPLSAPPSPSELRADGLAVHCEPDFEPDIGANGLRYVSSTTLPAAGVLGIYPSLAGMSYPAPFHERCSLVPLHGEYAMATESCILLGHTDSHAGPTRGLQKVNEDAWPNVTFVEVDIDWGDHLVTLLVCVALRPIHPQDFLHASYGEAFAPVRRARGYSVVPRAGQPPPSIDIDHILHTLPDAVTAAFGQGHLSELFHIGGSLKYESYDSDSDYGDSHTGGRPDPDPLPGAPTPALRQPYATPGGGQPSAPSASVSSETTPSSSQRSSTSSRALALVANGQRSLRPGRLSSLPYRRLSSSGPNLRGPPRRGTLGLSPDSSSALPPDFLQLQLCPPRAARTKNKVRTRAVLILTDRLNILCLRIGDVLRLPGGTVPDHLRHRPRATATDYFRSFFGQPTDRLAALLDSPARRYGRGETAYFILVIPFGFPPILDELPSESPLACISSEAVSAHWLPVLDSASSPSPEFHNSDDSEFLLQASRAAQGGGVPRSAAAQLISVFSAPPPLALLSTASAPLDPLNQEAPSCVDASAYGPSYHKFEQPAFAALAHLDTVLSEPGHSRLVALDLEGQLSLSGRVELIQLCIHSTVPPDGSISLAEADRYTHVFDIRRVPSLLHRLDSPLRLWLSDPTIVKIVHCGRGDGLTLFGRYGITLRSFFDTGVADALVVGHHPFSGRNLGAVLRSHVAPHLLRLDHKSSFEHAADTWTRRPITVRLFEYAYQDVYNCISLYCALIDRMSLLCPQNPRCLVDLTFSITATSQPPLSLPCHHPAARQPPLAVFVVHDNSHVLALRRPGSPSILLPTFSLSAPPPTTSSAAFHFRREAVALWCAFFGKPTKSGQLSLNIQKMRKAIHLAEALVYEVEVPCLHPVVDGITGNLPAAFPSDLSFAYEPIDFSPDSNATVFAPPHSLCLIYFLHLRAFTRRQSSKPRVRASALLSADLAPTTPPQPSRLYLLVHDGVYCLIITVKGGFKGAGGGVHSLPFSRPLADSHDFRLAAHHGFEVMVGPLSRYSSYLGYSVRAASAKGRLLDDSSDQHIYECLLDRSAFPLEDHVSSFTVAWHNRRLTATLASNVLNWQLVRLAQAPSLLPSAFHKALAAARSPLPSSPSVAPVTCYLHLLILVDTVSGPSLSLLRRPDGSANFDGFGGITTNNPPFTPILLSQLWEQLIHSSAVELSVEHALSARPEGSVGYYDSSCCRVWCIHLNVSASRTVAASQGSPALATIRLTDFISDTALAEERPTYLRCCEIAINNAIRVAYPRVVPSIPLLPPRSTRPDCYRVEPLALDLHKAPSSLSSSTTLFQLPPAGPGLHKASAFQQTLAIEPSTPVPPSYSPPVAFLSSGGTTRLRPSRCPPAWICPPGSLAVSWDEVLSSVPVLFSSLVLRLPPGEAASYRNVVSNGWLCAGVAACMAACSPDAPSSSPLGGDASDLFRPPLSSAASSSPTPPRSCSPVCLVAEPAPEEGGILPDSGTNNLGQFGTHRGFHTRYRRPASGCAFLPRPPTLPEIISGQRSCTEYCHIYSYLHDGPAYHLSSQSSDPSTLHSSTLAASRGYRLVDGVLVFLDSSSDPTGGYRIVLPPTFRSWAMHAYHDLHGHQGVHRTVGLISRLYYWPSLASDVAEYIRLCDVCARSKVPPRPAGAFHLSGDGDYPWDVVTMDLYTVGFNDDGYDHVLVFADQFTRGVVTSPVKGTPSSKEVFHLYFHDVARYKGFARRIRTDRGSIFISDIITSAYTALRIRLEPSTAAHHETVGLAERFNKVLHSLLLTHRVSTADPRWTRYLPHLEIAYNAAIHSRTGFSPFYVEHGRDFPLSLDVAYHGLESSPPVDAYVAAFVDRLQTCWSLVRRRHLLHALSSKRAQDICHDTSLKFFVGQRVLVIKEKGGQFAGVPVTKWHEPTHGPYRVVETLPNDNYKLSDLPSRRFHDTFHVSRLVPYPLVTSEGDGPLPDGEYIVDRIADRRLIPGLPPDELGSYEYLVHWLGYAPSDDTWEPVRVLANAMDDINAYNLLHPVPLADPPHELTDTSEFNSPLPSASQRRTFRRPSGPLLPVAEEPLDNPPPAAEQGPSDPSPEQEPTPSDSFPSAQPPADQDDPSSADDPSSLLAPTEWFCTSCHTQNHGTSYCSKCGLSRSLFGADFTTGRPPRRSASLPPSSAHALPEGQLRRIYTRPFRHPHGPTQYRVNPAYKDRPRSDPRAVVEFYLSRSGRWEWVYPGPRGEHLTIDEFNRVRAFRLDHPDSYPTLDASRLHTPA